MLKLVFYTKDLRLKVRLAFPHEQFENCCTWKESLEFTVTDDGDYTMVWTSLLPDLEAIYAEALVDLVGARYPVSPQYENLLQVCPTLAFKNTSAEWVFYGGSFNPWHHGHQACLDLLPEDKVCLVLPDRNPQKELRDIHAVSTILQISTLARFKKCQFLVPSFLMEKKKNPTVEWIEKLSRDFPDHKLSLLMGFDSFSHLGSWVRAEDLLSKLHAIYIVSRLEEETDRSMAYEAVKKLSPKPMIIFLGKHPYEDVSSTALRKTKED